MDALALLRQILRLRTALAILALLFVGVILFALAGSLHGVLSQVVDGVAVAVVTTGVAGLVYEVWLRRSTQLQLIELIGLAHSVERSGIVEVSTWRAVGQSLDQFFVKYPGHIDIFVTYGETLAKNLASRLAKHAAAGPYTLTITTLDPAAPEAVRQAYANLFSTTLQVLDARIPEARNVWKEAAAAAKVPSFTIRNFRTILPCTYYRSGNHMWVVRQKASPSRDADDLPVILCRKTGNPSALFDWIVSDIEACTKAEPSLLTTEAAATSAADNVAKPIVEGTTN